MPSVVLPILAKDHVGAAYIPRAARMHAARSDLLIVVKADTGVRPVEAALKEHGVPILNTIKTDDATALIVRPPDDLRAVDLWTRMGISARNLAERDRTVDLDDHVVLMRRFRDCLNGAGIASLETPRRIGMNLAGSVVYETIGGRVAVNQENQPHYEYDRLPDGREKGIYRDRFLRAIGENDLRGCAEGIARSIATGEQFDRRKLAALHADIVSNPDQPGLDLFSLQEEIEAALVVQAARLAGQGIALRDIARELNDRTAAHGERTAGRLRLQQYSTPLTISSVAADILRIRPEDVVLEPTAGNGALAIGAAVAGARVEGFEIDESRAARGERTLREAGASSVAISARAFPHKGENAEGRSYDVVLANPPFEGLKQSVETDRHGRKLAINRLDHRIVYDSLEFLKADTGRAFLVLPGEMKTEGKLEGALDSFNRYLHATFDVAGAAMLDGRLYRKSGAEFPVILYALGPRLEEPKSGADVKALPSELPYLRTTDELFGWGDATSAAMMEIMERRGVWSAEQMAQSEETARARPSAEDAQEAERPAVTKPRQRRWFPRRAPGEDAGSVSGRSASAGERDTGRPAGRRGAPPVLDGPVAGVAPRPVRETQPTAEIEDRPERGETRTAGGSPESSPAPGQSEPVSPPAAVEPPPAGELEVPPIVEAPEAPPVFADTMPDDLDEEDSLAITPEVLIDDIVFDNDPFQVTYEPASKVGGPLLKIQKALAAPVAEALADLERIRGPIDAFVADQLGVPEEELGALLHAGQVDGVGLSLHKSLNAKSVIIGDLMGVGKGRQLAAMTRAALKDDRPVLFFTDNPALFTDFIARDVATVLRKRPSELVENIRPYIVNSTADASIIDPEFEGVRRGAHGYVFKAASAAAKKGKEIDSSVNMVLSSYSQLGAVGRQAKLEAIIDWLKRQDRPPLLMMDESHKAAGEASNVGQLMQSLVEHVTEMDGSVVYSSGTALKGARNLRVYGSALPDVGLPTDRLVELIEQEPLALQEALSFEMARGGALIARELDNTNVARETLSLQDIDPNRYAQVLEKVDLFANHMAELLALGREVKAWSTERERELENLVKETAHSEEERTRALGLVNVHYQSPASRFHHLSNYLTLSINGVFLEDMVLRSISEGRKPVIAVANTGDALLRDLISQQLEDNLTGDDEVAVVAPGGEVRLSEKPNLGHVVKRMADRLLTVKESNGFGVTAEVRLEEYEGWLVDFNRRVDEADFSLLSLSVIDDLSAALEKHGLSLGEITGRSFTIRQADDGGYIASSRPKPLKHDVVSAFNNGRSDVLLLNQSAAVGLSAHSSPAVGFDVRPREMIKAQMQADVAQERQIDGRINRVGQLHPPLYTIPQQGLASSDRLAQLFNRKNRSLTSASTATRENESNISEALDLLNEVGQFVSFEYLSNNPDIAELLDINIDVDIDPEKIRSGFSEKLMGRMIALPTGMQRAIMGELDTAFQMRVGLLDALGENPLRLREYDWKAQVEEVRQLIAGDQASERMSERSLVLNKITYREAVKPLRTSGVDDAIARGEGRMVDDITRRRITVEEKIDEIAPGTLGKAISFSDTIFDRLMNRAEDLRSLGAQEHSVEKAAEVWSRRAAIEAAGDAKGFEKMVVEAGNKVLFLHQIAPLLEPGAIVAVNPAAIGRLRETSLFQAAVDYIEGTSFADSEIAIPAVITDVRFDEEKALNLGAWDIRLAVPGEERLIELPLASAFAAAEDARQKGEASWVLEAAQVTDNALGLMKEIAPMWSEMLTEALYSAGGEPFAATADDIVHAAKFGGGTAEAQLMELLIENVAGGHVSRTRYAVEGNLFAAVSALAGKRMGEKAMYTDETGTIRHCYLLKKDGHKKVIEKLGKSIASRVSYVKPDENRVQALLDGFHALTQGLGIAGPPDHAKAMRDYLLPQFVPDIEHRLADLNISVDPAKIAGALEPKLAELHVEFVKAVRELGTVNTGLFVGSDPFGDPNEKLFSTCCAVRVRERGKDEECSFAAYHDPTGVARLASAVSEAGAFAAYKGNSYDMVVKAKNHLCDKKMNGMAADWNNRGLTGATLRHATVGRSSGSSNEVARMICHASLDPKLGSGMVGIKGALVAYNDLVQVVSRRLAAELSADRSATAELVSGASTTAKPEKSASSAMSATM